jgi:hypothetical protein
MIYKTKGNSKSGTVHAVRSLLPLHQKYKTFSLQSVHKKSCAEAHDFFAPSNYLKNDSGYFSAIQDGINNTSEKI